MYSFKSLSLNIEQESRVVHFTVLVCMHSKQPFHRLGKLKVKSGGFVDMKALLWALPTLQINLDGGSDHALFQ